MKLDGYIRVSRVGGRSGDSFISPDLQREQIARWAAFQGHEVVAWHEDLDQSGGTIRRPGFQAMLTRIEAGETDGVVVPRLDRFGRSVPRIYEALERIESAGGQLLSVAEDFNLATANGRAHFNMLGLMAQYQRDQATEAWDASNRRAIERGIHFTNRPPLGYVRSEDRRLMPDPATAPLVREVFQRRAMRESWSRIADWLNEVHPRADGRHWSSRNIATTVQNRAYLGEAFHGEHRNTSAHEALVTPQEWEAANAVKGGPGAVRGPSSLLAGLIRCAGCRYAMRRTFTTYRDGRRVELYSCQRRYTGGRCSAPANVMAHVIEPYVVEHVMIFLGHTTWEDADPDGADLDDARRKLAHAEAQLAAFLADDELREAVGREAFLSQARTRREAVDRARADVERMEGQRVRDERRRYVLAEEWAKWGADGHVERHGDLLRTVLETVYVRKGRGPIDERVIVRWDGEDRFQRPQRGTTTYTVQPIPWPGDGPHDAFLASIPEWAWRNGHPAIPEDVRGEVHEMALQHEATHFLEDAAA